MNAHRILVVEDEAITAMGIKSNLEKWGYEVPYVASSGEEALELVKKSCPDLILMDIMLNGDMDGTQTAEKIIEKKKIPIVYLSAYSDNETTVRAKKSTPYGYLTKPFKQNDLRVTVEMALFKYQMEVVSEQESTRLKNEFLKNMSHELRTPLNGINGSIEILHQGVIDPNSSQHKELLDDALTSSHQLIKLIDGVLKFTELESEKPDLSLTEVNIEQYINEILELIIPTQPRLIPIKIQVDPTVQKVRLNKKYFGVILENYISNSLKFSNDENLIKIQIVPETEKFLKLEVSDEGIGIREEDMHKLFMPFKQLDMKMSKKYQGAGFGLALTKKIVEVLGGSVGAKSSFGKGSLFYAILPYEPLKT